MSDCALQGLVGRSILFRGPLTLVWNTIAPCARSIICLTECKRASLHQGQLDIAAHGCLVPLCSMLCFAVLDVM